MVANTWAMVALMLGRLVCERVWRAMGSILRLLFQFHPWKWCRLLHGHRWKWRRRFLNGGGRHPWSWRFLGWGERGVQSPSAPVLGWRWRGLWGLRLRGAGPTPQCLL